MVTESQKCFRIEAPEQVCMYGWSKGKNMEGVNNRFIKKDPKQTVERAGVTGKELTKIQFSFEVCCFNLPFLILIIYKIYYAMLLPTITLNLILLEIHLYVDVQHQIHKPNERQSLNICHRNLTESQVCLRYSIGQLLFPSAII